MYTRISSLSQILMRLELSRRIFEKFFNIKYHTNPSNGSRVVPRRRRDGWTDRETERTKLIVTLANLRTRLKIYR